MPRPGSPLQSNAGRHNTQTGEPYYSNEDVAILHDIVVFAQELLPTLPDRERLPTNALFNAYYDILPRVGINADHDSRYARVLFKIGGLRGQGTLYQKFEEVLSRMGIEIEFERDEFEDRSSQSSESQDDFEAIVPDIQAAEEGQHERRRRNSESTMWELGMEAQPRSSSRNRRNSFSNVSKDQGHIAGRPKFLDEAQRVPLSSIPNTAHHQNNNNAQPADNVRSWLESKAEKPSRRRGRSVSTHASMRIRRRSKSTAQDQRRPTPNQSAPVSDEYPEPSEVTAVTSVLDEDGTMDSVKSAQEFAEHRANAALMEIKASLFLHHHLTYVAKQQLTTWRNEVVKLRQGNRKRDLIAIRHDKKALLQGALADWRNRLQVKRSIVQTKQFFAYMGQRASKARNLYLMHVAFTHWQASAAEQVERTALARRHIVRTRVFHAWREYTAVNELKVRQQILKKFFGVWRREQEIKSNWNKAAVQLYEDNLIERVYCTWSRKQWDIKAVAWWVESTKRRTLFRWIVITHNTWEDKRTAEEIRRYRLIRTTWRIWKAKTELRIRQNQQAEALFNARTCLKPLRKWLSEARVTPAREAVRTNVKTRLLHGSFRKWLRRVQQERQAVEVDRTKILREAWTNWMHKNRSQVTISRVNGRVLSQAIYKWLLAARLTRRRRELDTEVKSQFLYSWFSGSLVVNRQRLGQDALAKSHLIKKTQDKVLKIWSTRTTSQKELNNVAADFHNPRLLQSVVFQWSDRTESIQQLQKLSQEADFYFLTSRSLKRWRASAESSRREKRKVAYTQVRRTKKVNSARGVLQTWKLKAQAVSELLEHAQEVSHNRNVIVGMNIFDRWRARSEEVTEMEFAYRETVLQKHLSLWNNRSNSFQELRGEAIIAYQERRQTRVLKKWNLQSLQLGAQLNYAMDIREKNAKRTFRKIFNYWHQQAAQRRPIKHPENSDNGHLSSTVRAETWSDFGDEREVDEWAGELDTPVPQTPVPGYMSTPSKRTERVIAAAARFSTTPKVQMSTPFERQLRAQYSGTVLPSHRKPAGWSTIGRSFADIPNKQTNNE